MSIFICQVKIRSSMMYIMIERVLVLKGQPTWMQKKDPSITMQDVKDWFSENIERKTQLSGYNSFVAPEANYEYQLDWICFLFPPKI